MASTDMQITRERLGQIIQEETVRLREAGLGSARDREEARRQGAGRRRAAARPPMPGKPHGDMRRVPTPQPPASVKQTPGLTPVDYDAALTKLKEAHAAVEEAIELLANDSSMVEHLSTLDSLLSRIKVAVRKKL